MKQRDGTKGTTCVPASSALPGIQNPNKRTNLVVRSPQSNKRRNSGKGWGGGSRSRVLKSQVCSCNKRLCSLLPEPPPNEAIAVVTDGNCRRDGQTPPDRVIEVNPRGQRAVFRPKVLVNFGKQRSVPLLPIRELSALLLPLKHASASLRPLVPRGSGGGPRD